MIKLTNVNKVYRTDRVETLALENINLDVAPGEFRELTAGEVTALGRAARGLKVTPKQKTPEFAQLKKPVPPKVSKRRAPTSRTRVRPRD